MIIGKDGALLNRDGTKVGHIIRSGRMLKQFVGPDQHYVGDVVCHGFQVNDIDGQEVFWGPHWGDATAHGCRLLRERMAS